MPTVIDSFVAPVCNEQIETLFQDESILLINKPSGLLSLSGKNPLNKDSVHFRLVQQFPTVTMAHRLDFGTSGIMVLALNKPVNANLTRQLMKHRSFGSLTRSCLMRSEREPQIYISSPTKQVIAFAIDWMGY